MKYVETFNSVEYDELFGGGDGFPVETINVNVGAGTEIKRGNILAGDSPTGTFALATSDDTSKTLVIAAEDFIGDSDSAVTTCYRSGKFNREKLSADSAETIAALETELRRQNIILTSLVQTD